MAPCADSYDKGPKGWYTAFDVELESFRRLEVMVPIKQTLLDMANIEILPCRVVMVKKPNGDGTCCIRRSRLWKFPTGTAG